MGELLAVVVRHRLVVNCRTVLGSQCPVCGAEDASQGIREPEGTGPDDAALCPGIVVVHVDGAVMCSELGCVSAGSLGERLARHATVVTCPFLPESCARCSGEGDQGPDSSRR